MEVLILEVVILEVVILEVVILEVLILEVVILEELCDTGTIETRSHATLCMQITLNPELFFLDSL